MNKQILNSLFSLLLIGILVALVYFSMVFRSENKFSVIWLYCAWYAGVVISLFAAIYYMWSYQAGNDLRRKSFQYNFTGTLNWVVGITGFLLVENTGLWLVLFMTNCIIGFFIYKDIFIAPGE